MGKMPVVGYVMIGLIIFFIMIYLAGFTIGKGILSMIKSIPIVAWFFIFLFVFLVTTRREKK